MSLEAQRKAAEDAVQDAARRSTVGLVMVENGPPLLLGSGSLVSWADEHLILTAEHVIRHVNPAHIRLLLPADRPPKRTSDRHEISRIQDFKAEYLIPTVEVELGRIRC